MVPIGSTSFTVPGLAPVLVGPEADPIVVRLRGEHDCSTDDALCLELARAIALNDAALVLDMSEVRFISASTLGVIVRARNFLRGRSCSLTVRCPSAFARRVIDVCGLGELAGGSAPRPGDLSAEALGSWVAVPDAERSDGLEGPLAPAPVPARLARASVLSAASCEHRGRGGGTVTKVAVAGGP